MKVQRLVLAVAALLACEESENLSPPIGPPGGIIEVDPRTIPIGGVDAGTAGAAGGSGGAGGGNTGGRGGNAGQSCATEPAAINSAGVLTAFPRIATSVTPAGLTLKSLNFVITEDGASRGPLLEMFGEVLNSSSRTECSFLPDVMLGFDEIISIVEAAPHFGTIITTVTTDCIGPGRTGVLIGVQRG